MAPETNELVLARKHLRDVESSFLSADVEFHLEEGLALLEVVCADGGLADRTVAERIGATYVERFTRRILASLDARDVPEPDLKHLMRMSRILSRSEFAAGSPADLAGLTAEIARKYIDAMFEGYSKAEKEREIRRLMKKLEGS